MYTFVETYNFELKESLLYNPKCFASWLNAYYDRIKAACENDEISLETFKTGVLKMIRKAASWSGRDRFICDVYNYRTKEQILERCEIAIKNARKLRNT